MDSLLRFSAALLNPARQMPHTRIQHVPLNLFSVGVSSRCSSLLPVECFDMIVPRLEHDTFLHNPF
jgi:hypothetical protein